METTTTIDRPRRLLIVDDEELNRELLEGMVERLGHHCETAASGFEALQMLDRDLDLVLLDGMMPGMDGFEVARRIRRHRGHQELPIIMVTALSGREDRLRAVEAGANDFIAKPIDRVELEIRMASLLQMKATQDAIKRQQADLEELVAKRTADLCQALTDVSRAQQSAQEAHLETIHRLAVAAEYRDGHTAAHIHRVGHYCAVLARGLCLSPNSVETVFRASTLHDVGKLGTPDAILLKPGKLTDEEFAVMRRHTVMGAEILKGSASELLRAGEVIALSHHEKWDGSGYPHGLAGEAIPLYGRICAVADVFDALTSRRPYKEAFANARSLEILRAGRGAHFDPQILDLFFDHLADILAVQEQYRDE